jgi:hypothetical protein
MKFRWYSFAFALVNWAEATASLLTLGHWCPGWTFEFSAWHVLREQRRRVDAGKAP